MIRHKIDNRQKEIQHRQRQRSEGVTDEEDEEEGHSLNGYRLLVIGY
jgi:hypothetical protein